MTNEKKKKVNPHPLKDSKRSKRRAARGFRSLSESSRKHRRAARRSLVSRSIDNVAHEIGSHAETRYSGLTQHAGGSINYNR